MRRDCKWCYCLRTYLPLCDGHQCENLVGRATQEYCDLQNIARFSPVSNNLPTVPFSHFLGFPAMARSGGSSQPPARFMPARTAKGFAMNNFLNEMNHRHSNTTARKAEKAAPHQLTPEEEKKEEDEPQ